MRAVRRWLLMSCLCMSGGMIFLLPFLREVYYIPLQKALHLTNTQFGALMSAFGTTSMIAYFPGGWLADRFSPKKLMTISLISTGLAGLYFARFPSYGLCIAIHAFWGISITLVFWAALIKATRNWASAKEQGRAFGILEGGRGITEVVSSTALLALFARMGSDEFSLSTVIILLSVLNVLLGLLTWLVMDDAPRHNSDEAKERIGLREIVRALKMPQVWLVSAVICTAYSAYWGSYYFTPYATDVFRMSVVFGGALGVGKMWLKPLSALGAGFIADKAGVSKVVAWSFVILLFSFGVFAFIPGNRSLVIILVVNTAIASLAIFALRGIYFALFEESGVPLAITGTVTGIVSVIGYTPDVFMPIVGGLLLDRFKGPLGFRYFFMFIATLSILGFIGAVLIWRRARKKRGFISVTPPAIA